MEGPKSQAGRPAETRIKLWELPSGGGDSPGGAAEAPERSGTRYQKACAPDGGLAVTVHTSRETAIGVSTLRLGATLPARRALARCPGKGFTPPPGQDSLRTCCGCVCPVPCGGFINDQSTKQRGRNGSLWTSGVIGSWLTGPWVPGVPGDSRVGWFQVLTFCLSIDKTHSDEGFIPQLTGGCPHTEEGKGKRNGNSPACHQSSKNVTWGFFLCKFKTFTNLHKPFCNVQKLSPLFRNSHLETNLLSVPVLYNASLCLMSSSINTIQFLSN